MKGSYLNEPMKRKGSKCTNLQPGPTKERVVDGTANHKKGRHLNQPMKRKVSEWNSPEKREVNGTANQMKKRLFESTNEKKGR